MENLGTCHRIHKTASEVTDQFLIAVEDNIILVDAMNALEGREEKAWVVAAQQVEKRRNLACDAFMV